MTMLYYSLPGYKSLLCIFITTKVMYLLSNYAKFQVKRNP